MPNLTIFIDDEEELILEKRAKKNLMDLNQQVQDIIRRSCVNSKNKLSTPKDPCDDRLVKIFSKQNRGKSAKKSKEKKGAEKIRSLLKKGETYLVNDKSEAKKHILRSD